MCTQYQEHSNGNPTRKAFVVPSYPPLCHFFWWAVGVLLRFPPPWPGTADPGSESSIKVVLRFTVHLFDR